MENEIVVDEVGYFAKLIDEEMTIFERMKIKKSTLKRMAFAMLIYSTVMITFSLPGRAPYVLPFGKAQVCDIGGIPPSTAR